MLPISVTILTKNSALYLREVLTALAGFEQVLIYDTGSEDETLAIASTFPNVTLERGSFIGFGPTHNNASSLAHCDWILSVDSDELLSKPLVEEIAQLHLDRRSVYSIARENLFYGEVIRGCGWWPDRQLRLYNRKETCFSDDQVHEKLLTAGLQVKELHSPLRHFSYRNASDLLTKMQLYSELFAEQNRGKKSSSLSKALGHGCWAFIRSYLLKRGFRDGGAGLVISLYNAHTAYYKYVKLLERNRGV